MKTKQALPIEDVEALWQQRLNTIPTVFGRMVYMAQQRRLYGRYTDPDIEAWTTAAVCQRVIRDAHLRVFRAWLALDIGAKATDLKPYFQTITFVGPVHDLRLQWHQLCRDLIPPRVSATEVNLFLGTAQTLLKFFAKKRTLPRL